MIPRAVAAVLALALAVLGVHMVLLLAAAAIVVTLAFLGLLIAEKIAQTGGLVPHGGWRAA